MTLRLCHRHCENPPYDYHDQQNAVLGIVTLPISSHWGNRRSRSHAAMHRKRTWRKAVVQHLISGFDAFQFPGPPKAKTTGEPVSSLSLCVVSHALRVNTNKRTFNTCVCLHPTGQRYICDAKTEDGVSAQCNQLQDVYTSNHGAINTFMSSSIRLSRRA